ncbi:unknown [Clostridium sp. CAG:288]|nr:unknown [Clostridium sp. CAG:288]
MSNLKEQAVNQDLEINIDAVTSTTRGAIEIARLKNILAIVPLLVDEHLLNGDRVKELSLKNFNEFSRKIIWLKENTLSKCAKLFLNSIDEIDNNDN